MTWAWSARMEFFLLTVRTELHAYARRCLQSVDGLYYCGIARALFDLAGCAAATIASYFGRVLSVSLART